MLNDEHVRLSEAEVRELAFSALTRAGVSPSHAAAMAAVVTAAEMDDCPSHGLYRVIGCIDAVNSGKVDPRAGVTVRRSEGAVVRIDAERGFAPQSLAIGRPLLEEAARRAGIAALAINNCYHFSALWADIEPLAQRGLVVFAFTIGMHCVTLAGGARPALGTNPLAFAFPRGESKHPFVFDLSTSVVARGEVELHHRAGQSIPDGWGVDRDGRASNDPEEVLQGALSPFGGPKGAAIGLMVELLAGPLIGDLRSEEALAVDNRDGGPLRGGYLMLALDPKGFGSASEGIADADIWLADLAVRHAPARLPGDRRFHSRIRNLQEGVSASRPIVERLTELARG